MTRIINKERFRYMNAYIKYLDNGDEILQSWSTDVVLRKKNGELVRLWSGWSISTNKQVKDYCGKSLRDIPFEDGTFEETKRNLSVWVTNPSQGFTTANITKSKWFLSSLYGYQSIRISE